MREQMKAEFEKQVYGEEILDTGFIFTTSSVNFTEDINMDLDEFAHRAVSEPEFSMMNQPIGEEIISDFFVGENLITHETWL